MRDPAIASFLGEIGKVDADMRRQLQGGAFHDHIADILRQQSQMSDGIRRLGEPPAADLTSFFAPAAQELTQSLFAPPVPESPALSELLSSSRSLQDSIAGLGMAALGLNSMIAQMQDKVRSSFDLEQLLPKHDIGAFMRSLPDLVPIA